MRPQQIRLSWEREVCRSTLLAMADTGINEDLVTRPCPWTWTAHIQRAVFSRIRVQRFLRPVGVTPGTHALVAGLAPRWKLFKWCKVQVQDHGHQQETLNASVASTEKTDMTVPAQRSLLLPARSQRRTGSSPQPGL